MSDLPGPGGGAGRASVPDGRRGGGRRPGPDGDRRLSPAPITAASGRMIVIGAFLAALSIGLRSQTVWFTVPLLVLVLFDRVGRGVAGAMIGGGVMFVAGGLAWGIPLLVASGGLERLSRRARHAGGRGLRRRRDAVSQSESARGARSRCCGRSCIRGTRPRSRRWSWFSRLLGLVQLLWRDRRSLAAVMALAGPYLVVPSAVPGHVVHSLCAAAGSGRWRSSRCEACRWCPCRRCRWSRRCVSIAGVAIASPVLVAYRAEPSPTVRALDAMQARGACRRQPGALAMHQTFVRPLEAEDVGISPQLPSPPRLEWLELAKYWKSGQTQPIWFLADPMRSDLALIDPASRQDSTEFRWPLVARPAFGGMRPSAVRWYRMPAPGGSSKKAGR